MSMRMEVDGDDLVIRINTKERGNMSASGKMMLLTPGGWQETPAKNAEGKTISISINAGYRA